MLVHFYELFNTYYRKKLEGVFEIKFACEIFKNVSGSKPGNTPLNAENRLSVSFCFIVGYANEEINILVSALNIIFFLFFDVNLNTQDFVHLEFVKYQLGLRRNGFVLNSEDPEDVSAILEFRFAYF